MAVSDPNLSILVEQLTQRLQAVENQVAILSQRAGVPYSSGFSNAPPTGGVWFDPKTGTVSFDPSPAAPPMGAPATDRRDGGYPGRDRRARHEQQEDPGHQAAPGADHCDLATAKKVVDGL
jgi:hypothetical protein